MGAGDLFKLAGRARLRVLVGLASLAIGFVLARQVPMLGAVLWFAVGAGLCAGAIAWRGWVCRVCLALCLMAAGAGWFAARVNTAAPLASLLADEDDGAIVCVEGTVLTEPREVARRAGALAKFQVSEARARFDFAVERILTDAGPVEVSGKLWVRVGEGKGRGLPRVRAGERVRLMGEFGPIEGPMNPGEQDLRLYAAEMGFAGSLKLDSDALTSPLEGGGLWRWWLGLHGALEARAREVVARASGTVEDENHEASRALLMSLILGEYDPSQQELRDAFSRQGLAHILAISGFHLTLMAILALVVLRLTGDRGWVEPAIVAALVLAYLLVIPASAPILRSAAMVLIMLLAEALGRRYDRLTLLLWIAFGVLVWRPLDLWSLGFQHSFGVTAVLLWIGPAFHARVWGERVRGIVLRERTVAQKLLEHFRQFVSSGILCWAVSAPMLMVRLGIVSPLAIVATTLVMPFMVAVLWLGYLALFFGVIFTGAAGTAGLVLSFLSSWTVRVVQLMDAAPFTTFHVPVVSAWWAAGATGLAIYVLRWGHARDWRSWTGGVVIGCWLAFECVAGPGLARGVALRLDTLSVGNGTCHLIRSGGEAVMWDCGPMHSGSAVEVVRALGVWRVPTVIVTHPDMDHFGGLPEVVGPLGVKTVVLCERFAGQAEETPRSAAGMLVRELRSRGVNIVVVHAGESMCVGECSLSFLSPPEGAAWKLDNDHSLVARVDLPGGAPALLMTGDIQEDAIGFLESRGLVRPEVLELPHHGSTHAAAIEFAGLLEPRVVVQSTGKLRVRDPKWAGVRERCVWLCTQERGAVWVEVGRDGGVACGGMR